MAQFAGIVRQYLGSFMAVRYVVSLVAALVVAVHAVLFMLGLAPQYTDLANRWRLTPVALLALVYLFIAAVLTTVWWLLAGRPWTPMQRYQRLRPLYRTTDPTGLRLFDILAVLAALLGAWAVGRYFTKIYILPVQFLTAAAVLPVVLGWLPTRPRRAWTPQHGEDMLTVARTLTGQVDAEDAAVALIAYNEIKVELDGSGNVMPGELEHPLPEGMVIEVPPQF